MENKKNTKRHLILKCLLLLFASQNLYCQTDSFLQKLDSQNVLSILPLSQTIVEDVGFRTEVKVTDFEGFKIVIVEWTPFICTGLDSDFLIFKPEKTGFRCVYHERNIGYNIGDIPIYDYEKGKDMMRLYTTFRNGTTLKELNLKLLPQKNAIKIIDQEAKDWVIVLSSDKNEEDALFELKKAEKLEQKAYFWILKNKNVYRTMLSFQRLEEAQKRLAFFQKTFPTAYIKDAHSFCNFPYNYEQIVECWE